MTTPPAPQPSLIKAMLDPDWYNHPATQCRLIETHISWVILAGDYVYKVKKPLDLGFLDFSTLEKRRLYCEEELRLNRRLAPSVYLDVVTITGSDSSPKLGGYGDAIEYAVKMVRFPQEAQLDRMLESGKLQPEHLDAFARRIARFHQSAEAADATSPFGDPTSIRQPVTENFSQIRTHINDTEALALLAKLDHWSNSAFARLEPIIRARKAAGFIRECHGDMHLRNLAWINDKPVAFDGIEFNPNLRWIDVISEIAFLVMDLHDRAEQALSQRFLNTYLERTGDYAGLAVLPFYLVYRALVRAKVAAIRLSQPGQAQDERNIIKAEFIRYLRLAERYTRPQPIRLLLTRGLSGTGKTTISQPLLEQLPAIRIRSDVERKRLYGLVAEQAAHSAPADGIYTAEATDRTYRQLLNLAEDILKSGYSVIIDATFLKRTQREPFRHLAQVFNAPFIVLDFSAPAEILRQRLLQRKGDASDADLAVLAHQLECYRPLDEDERKTAISINTAGKIDFKALSAQINALSAD